MSRRRRLNNTNCISYRGVRLPHPKKECPKYNTKLHLIARHQFWSAEYSFIIITPSSNQTQNSNTY